MLYALDPFIYDPVIIESREIEMKEQDRFFFSQGHLFSYWADPFKSPTNLATQGIQGSINWKIGFYGAGTPLIAVFALELFAASIILGTIGYFVDPLDRYHGGLAETKLLHPLGGDYDYAAVWASGGTQLGTAIPTASWDPKFDIGMRWGQL